jgi:hypothetical protein
MKNNDATTTTPMHPRANPEVVDIGLDQQRERALGRTTLSLVVLHELGVEKKINAP